MMFTYFSTFQTGFEEVVRANISTFFSDIIIQTIEDGFIVYETSLYTELPIFTNTFLLLKHYSHVELTQKGINEVIKLAYKDNRFFKQIREYIKNATTYRVSISIANALVEHDPNVMRTFDEKMQAFTSLALNKTLPETEVWFYLRQEGVGYAGLRLTMSSKKTLQGQLHQSLAALLCLVAPLHEDDIFLDPFCGSGAISIARARLGKANRIIAGDNDPETLKICKEQAKKNNVHIDIAKMDGSTVKHIEASSISHIVTDPPWGITVGTSLDIPALYTQMLHAFFRVLREDGIAVILTAQTILLEKLLAKSDFTLVSVYHTLVAGQKANVYYIKKHARN